jgi:hypothetical protein
MARLLDVLCKEATDRVNSEAYHEPVAAIKLKASTREQLQRFRKAAQTVQRLSQAWARQGLYYQKGRLVLDYRIKQKHRSDWQTQQTKRREQIKALQNKALLDLIDLPPVQVKAYYVNLKKKLAAI